MPVLGLQALDGEVQRVADTAVPVVELAGPLAGRGMRSFKSREGDVCRDEQGERKERDGRDVGEVFSVLKVACGSVALMTLAPPVMR